MLLVQKGNTMNVYIKSFNRPFYLDRCIRSIKLNVKGCSRIIVLDDGTQSQYLEKLHSLHPDVEFRGSGADDRKVELLRAENFAAIKSDFPEPASFWFAELSKEPEEYFFLMEDDAWVSRRLDLETVQTSLEKNAGVIYKCWWPNHPERVHIVQSSFLASNGQSVEYYDFNAEKVTQLYAIWIVAFAVFRRDYWLNNFCGIKRMADEHTQLCNAQNYISRHPEVRFAKSAERCVYQGWAVPGRSTPEYYDKGLRQHLYMDALNNAWLAGGLDVTEGFPFDFSDDYLASIFSMFLSTADVEVWKEWKKREIQYFYN
jgi:hypothetical protein